MKKIITTILVLSLVIIASLSFANELLIMPISAPITPLDQIQPISFTEIAVSYDNEVIDYDVKAQYVDGKLMVPLRYTLEKMGYTVNWNSSLNLIEVNKGAQFTTLSINKNSYIKNRMAPFELSSAPALVDGRTLVPVEFFHEVLSLGFHFENATVMFDLIDPQNTQDLLITHYGFVKDIEYTETGVRYSLSNTQDGEIELIINSASQYTIYQKEVAVGDSIKVISYPIMLLSYPGQAGGIVIY
jgi:hypothetical protein